METHPFNQQTEAKKYMDKYGVQIEAWAPFGEGRGNMFTHPVIAEIGSKYGKTVPQTIEILSIEGFIGGADELLFFAFLNTAVDKIAET